MLNPLPATSILRCEVGSTAHGTGIPGGEDHDETIIWVEPLTDVFHPLHDPGLQGPKARMERTQPEGTRSGPGDTDRQIYSLRRFLHLAANGNPSILMTFWAPRLDLPSGSTTHAEMGSELQRLGPAFISRRMIPRYRGYMQSQASRILGTSKGQHGARGGGGRSELIEQYGWDTKYAMHCARLGFQCLELIQTGGLELPMPNGHPTGDWLRALRRGDVSFDEWWDTVLQLDRMLGDILDGAPGNVALKRGLRPEPSWDRIIEFSILAHTSRGITC